MTEERRLPAPWRFVDTGAAFRVESADDIHITWIYYREDLTTGSTAVHLTRKEAFVVASNIVKWANAAASASGR
jgi:hypothetical protein